MAGSTCPVIILAGGKSSRFGRDKASEPLHGKPLLQHAIDACASVASRYVVVKARGQALPEVSAPQPLDEVEDAYPETGPLGGIYTGLQHLAGEDATPASALLVACDMPLLQPPVLALLASLADSAAAVLPVRNELPEPLCAAYATTCVDPARQLLEARQYRVAGLLDHVNGRLVPEEEWRRADPQGLSFLNVNRREDLEAVEAAWAEAHS